MERLIDKRERLIDKQMELNEAEIDLMWMEDHMDRMDNPEDNIKKQNEFIDQLRKEVLDAQFGFEYNAVQSAPASQSNRSPVGWLRGVSWFWNRRCNRGCGIRG